MDSIVKWLRDHELHEHAKSFKENGIGLDVLAELSEDDLKDLGLNLGDRRRFQATVRESVASPILATAKAQTTASNAERRQLTVMFCDLVGSTALSESMDPEQFRELLTEYRSAASRALSEFGGYIASYMGDGLLVYFGYPHAHEDDAERAIRAALLTVDSIERLNRNDCAYELQVRIGIATGLVVAGDLVGEGVSESRAVLGDTPNLAARLQGEAGPNEVVISEKTRRLAGGRFQLEQMPPRQLKGISDLVTPYKVIGSLAISRFGAAAASGLTSYVGRAAELEMIWSRWISASEGDGKAIFVCGEPGIGKSRLIEEFLSRARAACQPNVRHYQCSPHHTNSPLHPVMDALSRATSIDECDNDRDRLHRIEECLPANLEAPKQAQALLAELFGLSGVSQPELGLGPELQKELTLALLAECAIGDESESAILVVEDVHWADATTIEWLGVLLHKLGATNRLLIVNFRPEFEPSWDSPDSLCQLTLSRMGFDEGRRIVAEVVDHKEFPDVILDQILQKTDGVPLFVEELTKTVLESGLLEQTESGFKLLGPASSLKIPDTLKDSLTARLDRLSSAKEIAQLGACIGREFKYGLVTAVSSLSERNLDEALSRLVGSGLVSSSGNKPHTTFVFRHALVQDTAYESILLSRRQQLHLLLGEELEQQANPEASELARHFSLAGDPEKAASYYLRAGTQSLARTALSEAEAQLAFGLSEDLPLSETGKRLELELRVALGAVRMAHLGWTHDSVLDALEPAVELAKHLGDSDNLVRSVWGIWVNRACVGQFATAERWLGELANDDARVHDTEFSLVANMAGTATNFWLSNYSESSKCREAIHRHYDLARHRKIVAYTMHDPKVLSLQWAGVFQHWVRGYPDRALESFREMIEAARRLAHPFNLSFALTDGAPPLAWMGMSELGVSHAEEALEIAQENRLAFIEHCICPIFGGLQQSYSGDEETGFALFQKGLDFWTSVGGRLNTGLLWSELARAAARIGKSDEAMELVDRAIEIADSTGEVWFKPESLRLKGDLLLQQAKEHDLEPALVCYNAALALAKAQEAKSWELRAALSLAEVCQRKGEDVLAYRTLAPVYEWFTEGFDTPDLESARLMLEGLR